MAAPKVGVCVVASWLIAGGVAAFAEEPVTPPAPDPSSVPAPLGQKTHTVVDGDTLWGLSGNYLQSPWKWQDLFQANRDIVNNPHWIFPGQVLRIPPVLVTEGEEPPTPAPAPTEAAEPAPKPQAIAPPEPPVEMPILKILPPKKLEPPTVRVIPSLEKPRELIYSGALGAGFLGDEEYEDAPRIVGTMDHRKLMGQGDLIYIEFEEGPTVQKGEKYLIVRVGESIDHPDSGEDLGYRIEVLGYLEIEDLSSETASARVLVSYNYISPGDLIIPMQDQPERVAVKRGRKGLEGFVVAARDTISFLGQGHIVYIDLGLAAGVEAGQIFRIVRSELEVEGLEVPPLTVGELVVLRVGSNTSTALITRSNTTIEIGDHIESQ